MLLCFTTLPYILPLYVYSASYCALSFRVNIIPAIFEVCHYVYDLQQYKQLLIVSLVVWSWCWYYNRSLFVLKWNALHQASETLGRASVLGEGIGHGPSVVRGLPAHVGYNPRVYPGFLA
jgi:hypothetical protein